MIPGKTNSPNPPDEKERQDAILRREAEEHARRWDPQFEEDPGGGVRLRDDDGRRPKRSRKGFER